MRKIFASPLWFFERLRGWVAKRTQILQDESVLRSKLNEAKKFDNRWASLFSGAVVIIASALLLQKMIPSPGPESIFPKDPDAYHEITSEFLVESFEVPLGASEVRRVLIHLPKENATVTQWLDQRRSGSSIWYEFSVEIPEKKFSPGSFGLLIPKIWGNSEVYLNSDLVDFGRDNRPIYALKSRSTKVSIRLVPGDTELNSGIQALYPPAWGKIDLLRLIPGVIEAQHMVVPSAESVQLIGAVIFAIIALFSARKPEINRFVWFMVASLLFGKAFVAARDDVIVFHSHVNEFLLIFFSILRSLLVYWFFIEFARYLERRNQQYLIKGSLFAGLFTIVATAAIRNFFPRQDLLQAFQFTQELGFFIVTSLVATEILVYLQIKRVPLRRRIATLLLYVAVATHFGLNMFDYWFAKNRLTTEFSHNIGLIFLLIMVITAEFARQEKERDELLENLPKEEQRKINLGRIQAPTSTHVGFLLLIDTVAWSEHQEALQSTDQEWEFQNRVNQYLLEVFYHPETSLLTGTGDGFYFAWEGPAGVTTLRKITQMLDQLLKLPVYLTDLGLQSDGPKKMIEFRAALTFGEYAIGRSRYNDLTRDFATGKPLNRLSQVIGHGKGTLRLLCNDRFQVFSRIASLTPQSLVDKHGRERHYFEVFPSDLLRLLDQEKALNGILPIAPEKAA